MKQQQKSYWLFYLEMEDPMLEIRKYVVLKLDSNVKIRSFVVPVKEKKRCSARK